ncbi:hypothetical protein Tco_1406680 [Tanacetum coccineum]
MKNKRLQLSENCKLTEAVVTRSPLVQEQVYEDSLCFVTNLRVTLTSAVGQKVRCAEMVFCVLAKYSSEENPPSCIAPFPVDDSGRTDVRHNIML